MLPSLLRCLVALPRLRRAAGVARRAARRAAPGAGAAAPRVARRAALGSAGVRWGGMACLMAPLLAPAPAMGPLDMREDAGLAMPLSTAPGAMPAGPAMPGSGLMAASASVTGFEVRTIRPGAAGGGAGRPVVVPEPGTAALFATGVAALLWARRRRQGASGLDGAEGGR